MQAGGWRGVVWMCLWILRRQVYSGWHWLHAVVSMPEEYKFELYEIVLPANSLKTSLGLSHRLQYTPHTHNALYSFYTHATLYVHAFEFMHEMQTRVPFPLLVQRGKINVHTLHFEKIKGAGNAFARGTSSLISIIHPLSVKDATYLYKAIKHAARRCSFVNWRESASRIPFFSACVRSWNAPWNLICFLVVFATHSRQKGHIYFLLTAIVEIIVLFIQ